MGGNSSSTPESVGSQLSSLFLNNGGFQGGQAQLPSIQAPQYGPTLDPSRAAAATMARMQARTPMAAPASAPVAVERPRNPGGPRGLQGRD